MFRGLKQRYENKRKMFYRLRENTTESIINTKFSYSNDFQKIKAVVETFLEENKNYSITSSNAISYEVYGKQGIILKGNKIVLELDEEIYRLFRNKIEEQLNTYEINVINSWGVSSNSKINISCFSSGIETGKIVCDPGSVISVGVEIKSLNLNRTNESDMKLLNYILDCFFENENERARIEHIGERQFYLICGEGKLLFNFYAHDIISSRVIEFNQKLDNQTKGSSYTKKRKEEV